MEERRCDIHYWAMGDSKKRMTFYCSDCDANICKKCSRNYFLRALAMTNRWIDKKLK